MWCKKEVFSNVCLVVLVLFTIRTAVGSVGGFAWVESESMQPAIQPHDIVFFKHYRPGGERKLRRGYVVMFRAIDHSNQLWVKRIHEIVPKQSFIYLNNQNLKQYGSILKAEGVPIVVRNKKIYLQGKPQSAYRTEHTYLYVMGDNRSVSYDSRQFGYIPEDSVVATVEKVFSW